MNDRLGSSGWTVSEARSVTARLRQVAESPEESAGLELFTALCDYLDELSGDRGFGELLTGQDRYELAAAVQQVLSGEPSDGSERLAQPVDAPVTLSEGRELAEALAGAGGWAASLGTALRDLYAYLDHLSGGPGAFQVLLTRAERAQVVQAAPKR